jgi:hypothetical protein
MPEQPWKIKKSVKIIGVVLLLCVIAAVAWFIQGRLAKTPNQPPVAALRLDSLDETNRVATLSDAGSRDPDGTIQIWRIAWGDGKEEKLTSSPQKAAHTYDAEGQYTISMWCMDNAGATSSPPATADITFDLLKRQKAQELAEAEAKRQADMLKEEQARKEAERLEQEKQKEMAVEAARKAKEQQDLEAKRKAAAELAAQKAKTPSAVPAPLPRTPLASGLANNPSLGTVIFTPAGYKLGDYQIHLEKNEGKGRDGNQLVILATRCVNLPDSPIATADWKIDGKGVLLQTGRIRASLPPGQHDLVAILTHKPASGPAEIKAVITVGTGGDCVLEPRK